MRVLHTADWHVGKTLRRQQRLDEAEAVIHEVVEIAASERVDLTLVCGDLFDQFAPSAEAERIVYRSLVALRDAGSAVLVLPGNHDNAKRFAAIERLFEAAGILVVPEVRRPDQGGIVTVASRDRTQTAQVATLPWVTERLLFGAEQMMGLEEDPNKAYAEELPRLLSALCGQFEEGKVHLLAAHVFVGGARIGGGERELTVGDIFAIAPQALPKTPQYIALGHVHRPQEVPAAAVPARYAGSLLQLDFGEVDQQKSVTIVDFEPGLPAKVRAVQLAGGRRLLDVEGTLDDLRATDVDPEAFLRVTLRCEGPSPGLADDVRSILPNALEVRLDYERDAGARDADDVRRLPPRELFAQYYTSRHGAPADHRLIDLFDELFAEVTGETA
jgi:DNA repair protein SbcD/Mre11